MENSFLEPMLAIIKHLVYQQRLLQAVMDLHKKFVSLLQLVIHCRQPSLSGRVSVNKRRVAAVHHLKWHYTM
jgi:hypothetical protein